MKVNGNFECALQTSAYIIRMSLAVVREVGASLWICRLDKLHARVGGDLICEREKVGKILLASLLLTWQQRQRRHGNRSAPILRRHTAEFTYCGYSVARACGLPQRPLFFIPLLVVSRFQLHLLFGEMLLGSS